MAGARTQHALHQRLFRAYFTDNLDVADHGVLARLAGEVGLDVDAAAEVLATGGYADTVRAEERQAGELDIHAVPTFVIEGRWAIPGAQDVDTFAELLERARERLAPLTVGGPSAGAASRRGERRGRRRLRRRLLHRLTDPPRGVRGGEGQSAVGRGRRRGMLTP